MMYTIKKKKNAESHQNFTGSYKKNIEALLNFKIHIISKDKKENKLW